MKEIPFVSEEFINSNTNYPELVRRLRLAFADDMIIVPQRHHHDFPNPNENQESTMLLMPAWNPDTNAGVKIVTVSPNNSKYNLPTIQGVYLYLDARKGTVRALLDAKALTNKRTAAASALASTYLSRKDSSSLLMIGTGALSKNLIEAHAAVRPISEVFVYGRSKDKARQIADSMDSADYLVRAIDTIEEKIADVDIISCATLSTIPLVHGNLLRTGQHLDMVGAYKKDMREADDQAILRSTVFVDNFTGALKETGDLVIPLANGVIKKEDIKSDLFGLCAQKSPGRTSEDEITFFKSVGHALEDLVGAAYYVEQYQ